MTDRANIVIANQRKDVYGLFIGIFKFEFGAF